MRSVSVVGANMIRFGKNPKTLEEMGQEVVVGLLKDLNVDREKIDAVFGANVFGGHLPTQRVLKEIGMTGIPVFNVENACASGATAYHQAYQAIAHGIYDVALVIGVEKLTALGGGALPIPPNEIEGNHGIVMPGVYAMRAQRYLHDFNATSEDLALVSVKNRANGALNPYAQFQKPVTVEEVMSSRLIADPFTLLQCSANNGDGAAAVLVCATDRAKEFSDVSIKTEASVITSGLFKGGYRDLTWAEITYRAVNEAYQQANVKPEQIDMVEMHDAFTIAEVLYYEAMGFCEHGKGVEFLRDGKSQIDGQVAVNPSGGLISRGHPLGATGVAQIAETFWQLTCQAGKRQVKNPQYALTHVTGGGISGVDNGACGVHIFSAV